MAATGLLSLRAGAPDSAWIFTLHAGLGGSLLAATLVKLRRSLPKAIRARRFGRLVLGLVVSLATIAALTGGFLWVARGELLTMGEWTVLTVHAWIGLGLLPIVGLHLLPRRWLLLRPDRSPRPSTGAARGRTRRSFLAIGGLAVAGIASFVAAAGAEQLFGGVRRFTGSRWLPTGGIPPVTTFYGEETPEVDAAAWRIAVTDDAGQSRTWTLDELAALGETELTAVLDCTSGWAIETSWRGVSLVAILEASGLAASSRSDARTSVRVTSVTGWAAVLTMAEARRAHLATGVAGMDLPAANGAPCRLVVPDARGLDWVKWVTEIRIV